MTTKETNWIIKCPNGDHGAFKDYVTVDGITYCFCPECNFYWIRAK